MLLLGGIGIQEDLLKKVPSEIDLGSRHRGVHSGLVDTGAEHHPMVHMGSWHWVAVASNHQIGPHIWIA